MPILDLLQTIAALPPVMHLELHGAHYSKTYRHTLSLPANSATVSRELSDDLYVPHDILELELQPFYQFANGIKLFHNETDNDDSGKYFIPSIEFYPLERLANETATLRSSVMSMVNMGGEMPIYADGIAIGEAVATGNYFVLIRAGSLAGKIVYADQDPDINYWCGKPFADSLTHLISLIATPPHTGLDRICGASRIWF
ncbi:hypothetical protein ACO0K9_12000 [Undibacterium sp. Ji50W]|uniref:hypothetical protein n=1 Tax=Undibacterium sp. Ji50W TaxID=3413041 RepID=UPI003BF38759